MRISPPNREPFQGFRPQEEQCGLGGSRIEGYETVRKKYPDFLEGNQTK